MDEQSKSKVLTALLGGTYQRIERIRDRVYDLSIWTIGIFLGAASLIVQARAQLGPAQKAFLALTVACALGVVLFYIKDLERGFRNQFRVAVGIEKLLGLYEKGSFAADEAVYPAEWAESGTKAGKGRFFRNSYLLLCLGAAILLAAIGSAGPLF